MPFIGNKPSAVPLSSADIADGIITSAKIADGTIVNADINASSAIAVSKLSATGTSLQVLRMNSGATALEFATISTGATAGQVIQVVTATDSTERSTTSTSFVTGSNTLSVAITPSSASNKIFVIVNTGCRSQTYGAIYALFRDATNLGDATEGNLHTPPGKSTCSISILDSPSTTSSTTYQVYMSAPYGDNAYLNSYNGKGSLTAFEIKG